MNIYQEAVNKFGADHQILKAVEELNELATALLHYRQGKVNSINVAAEIADVQIMIYQLNFIIKRELIDDAMSTKLSKLNIAINQ